jgi:predicted O-methyltransferase YrrM
MRAPAIWQEVEFGSYGADLPLWVELASEADGSVVELGAGAGRVALHLAGHGHEVVAVEQDLELIRELEDLSERRGIPLTVVAGDLASPSELRLPIRPALAIGPLHVIQILEAPDRPALLARLSELMAPGGVLALTLVDETTMLSSGAASTQILPDMRELDHWVYSSEPLWVQVGDGALTVRRLREIVSPEGRMERDIHDEILHRVDADTLEREAGDAGFRPAGRRQISSGENEADSTVVLLEAPA